MGRAQVFAWSLAVFVAAWLAWLLSHGAGFPTVTQLLFWIALLAVAELLPVSMGFGASVTMGFPVHIAIEILFPPAAAMIIAGLSIFDTRELKREIPLYHAVFNRAQIMLAVGATSSVFHSSSSPLFAGDVLPVIALVSLGFAVHNMLNLGAVATFVSLQRQLAFRNALDMLLPKPVGGFWLTHGLLAGLGVATAAAYEHITYFVAAFLIPLFFARLSIIGARRQQELAEKVQAQQQALLGATEQVFQERERERHRIAEEIHDSSLQLLAAASYGCTDAARLVEEGDPAGAHKTITAVGQTLNDSITELRNSLMDLRRSAVEEGGLQQTICNFADDLSTLWGVEIVIEGELPADPPTPVGLAAFQILQEAVTNALKHSNSSVVRVKIGQDDGLVRLVVEDEGAGFDPSREVGADHVGMRLMKERASRVGGRIELASKPGEGTRLEAILPGAVTA